MESERQTDRQGGAVGWGSVVTEGFVIHFHSATLLFIHLLTTSFTTEPFRNEVKENAKRFMM